MPAGACGRAGAAASAGPTPGATRCWSCTPTWCCGWRVSALVGTVTLGAGERRYLSLAYTKSDPAVLPPLGRHAEERIADTIHWWREWAGAMPLCRTLSRAGGAQRRDAEAPHLCAVGRDRRGADDVAARGDRQGPQLGLPLLLAARCRPHHAGAAGDGLSRGGDGVPGLDAACHAAELARTAGHVRRVRPHAARTRASWCILRAMPGRGRCASATTPTASASSTSMARS